MIRRRHRRRIAHRWRRFCRALAEGTKNALG